MDKNNPKCWYCQETTLITGDINFWTKQIKVYSKLIDINGFLWHPKCLRAYRNVRQYLATNKGVQNPLSDNLLTPRKPLGLTKYGTINRFRKSV